MTILSFTASVIDSVAWPVAVYIIVKIFKVQLEQLLGSITGLKYKDLHINLSTRFGKAAQDSEQAAPQPPQLPEPDAITLANMYPAAAILDSWLKFETRLREFSSVHNIQNSTKLPTSRIADELRNQNLWDDATFRAFSELRELRNTVVHTRSGAITPTQAMEYQLAIQRLITKLI